MNNQDNNNNNNYFSNNSTNTSKTINLKAIKQQNTTNPNITEFNPIEQDYQQEEYNNLLSTQKQINTKQKINDVEVNFNNLIKNNNLINEKSKIENQILNEETITKSNYPNEYITQENHKEPIVQKEQIISTQLNNQPKVQLKKSILRNISEGCFFRIFKFFGCFLFILCSIIILVIFILNF